MSCINDIVIRGFRFAAASAVWNETKRVWIFYRICGLFTFCTAVRAYVIQINAICCGVYNSHGDAFLKKVVVERKALNYSLIGVSTKSIGEQLAFLAEIERVVS